MRNLRKRRIDAQHGEKVIELRVAFFTDEIASAQGRVVPKVCWDIGTVHLFANASHGIKSSEPYFFNGLSELPKVIEEILANNEIKILHSPKRTKKLYY